MRLLTRQGGKYTLTADLPQNEIPRYAILSHTWGRSDDEISFQDINDSLNDLEQRRPGGFRKLSFCADQAAKHGIDYFWIDTCCINKSNHSELDEAIRSMYRWYQCASKCYVYLSDLKVANPDNQQFWEHSFVQSRWFNRGWTLQELLAPTHVEFFSAEGSYLGSKVTLLDVLAENTGIATEALQGKPLTEFSSEERLTWARHRHTQREEDKAYCLLGIFEISMTIMYGEGKAKAMRRLKDEIRRADALTESSDMASAAALYFARRAAEGPTTQATPRIAVSSRQSFTLDIGNDHRVVTTGRGGDQNRHQWNYFVRPSDTDVIEAVHVFLHETFPDPHLIFNRPPFEVQRMYVPLESSSLSHYQDLCTDTEINRGWGVFTVTAIIVLKFRLQWTSSDVFMVNRRRQAPELAGAVPCSARGCGNLFTCEGDARWHFQHAHMSEAERDSVLFKQYGRGFYPCPDEGCEKVFVDANHVRTHWQTAHVPYNRHRRAPPVERDLLDGAIGNVLKVDWSLDFNDTGSKSTYEFTIREPAGSRNTNLR